MSWDQLKAILLENEKIKIDEETKEIGECPKCSYSCLAENRQGLLSCPVCGWVGDKFSGTKFST